jgi:hypothetical protein
VQMRFIHHIETMRRKSGGQFLVDCVDCSHAARLEEDKRASQCFGRS